LLRTQTGRGRIWGQPTLGRRRVSCWRGMAAVRTGARGLSAATQQPVTPANGMAEGACLTGGRTAFLLAGPHMAGKVSQRIGCGDPVAAPSTIPSPIGEARRAGGVIRSRSGWSNYLRASADDETRQARNGALFSIRRSNIAAHSTAPEHNTQREAARKNRPAQARQSKPVALRSTLARLKKQWRLQPALRR
jgi:hypothetical protein